jgi:2-polyprenyl-6-methoxyphenol hydroxylase-like FAD-dependent oxidoreductase
MSSEVLIVGAGPTGLVLALWLTRMGIRVRIIDRNAGPGTTSRAVAVASRTLELYGQLDLARPVVAAAHRVPAANLWARGRSKARVALEEIGRGLSPYPSIHMFPQDEHERLLIARLAEAGVSVERRSELLAFTEEGERIVARIHREEGREEEATFAFVAGCDGAHSVVRRAIGAEFGGGTYRQVFYVADIEAGGPAMNGELHIDLDEADFLAVFPLAASGRARLIGSVRDERADRADTLTFDDVNRRALDNLRTDVHRVNWFSTYRVHHRVADRFRRGRAFILGDAAHVHSPVGGQGMNTGIGDAINLAWKIAAVLRGRAPDTLLDSYEAERIAFARRLVATTDRVFTAVTAAGGFAGLVRTRIAPALLPALLSSRLARAFLFRTVSQIGLNYRASALSEGRAGRVSGGERLPWVASGATDNFSSFDGERWQIQVYGEPSPDLGAWCERKGVPLRVFGWSRACEVAGLGRDALYLLRPDSYVALADPAGLTASLEAYLARRSLQL